MESGVRALASVHESGEEFVLGSAATCLLLLPSRSSASRSVWKRAQCCPDFSHGPDVGRDREGERERERAVGGSRDPGRPYDTVTCHLDKPCLKPDAERRA